MSSRKATFFALLSLYFCLFIAAGCSKSSDPVSSRRYRTIEKAAAVAPKSVDKNPFEIISLLDSMDKKASFPDGKQSIILVQDVQNRTAVSFDTAAITEDLSQELAKNVKVQVARGDSKVANAEYQLSSSVTASRGKMKNGRKTIYRLHLRLTDISTKVEIWRGHSEIREEQVQ